MDTREAVDPRKKLREPKYRDSDHSVKAVVDRSECLLANFKMPSRVLPASATVEERRAYMAKTKYSALDTEGLRELLEAIKSANKETLEAELPILQTERARRCAIAEVERDYLQKLSGCLDKIKERLNEQSRVILRELYAFTEKHGAKKTVASLNAKHSIEDHPVSDKQGLVAYVRQQVKRFSLEREIFFETEFGARILFNREEPESKPIVSYNEGSMGNQLEHFRDLIEEEIGKVTPKLDELDYTMQMIGIFLSEVKPDSAVVELITLIDLVLDT